LAATDFSTTAGRACERAALLAVQHNARLILQHSLPGQAMKRLHARLLQGDVQTEAQLRNYFEGMLRQQAEEMAARWKIDVTPVLTVGQPHREITRVERENGVDLVVLGAMGEHPAREFFLGSTAERVVREAAVPVLVVRNVPGEKYRRVLAALDLSLHSPAVAQLARGIAPTARLTLAHAFEVPFEGKLQFAGVSEADIQRFRQEERQSALAALQALAESLSERPEIRVELGMPEATLPALVREMAADLVVAGKHGKSEVIELLLGSMTKHLLREVACDVLVAPSAQEARA
ncbi:MAG: universal stress protein, partial [Thiobacillus sp.]|nr:universal stress protein [Thiobacillus sp.]